MCRERGREGGREREREREKLVNNAYTNSLTPYSVLTWGRMKVLQSLIKLSKSKSMARSTHRIHNSHARTHPTSMHWVATIKTITYVLKLSDNLEH